MTNPTKWLARIKELQAVADDTTRPPLERIEVLTELYRMRQFDVHEQAKCVRQIRYICEDARNKKSSVQWPL